MCCDTFHRQRKAVANRTSCHDRSVSWRQRRLRSFSCPALKTQSDATHRKLRKRWHRLGWQAFDARSLEACAKEKKKRRTRTKHSMYEYEHTASVRLQKLTGQEKKSTQTGNTSNCAHSRCYSVGGQHKNFVAKRELLKRRVRLDHLYTYTHTYTHTHNTRTHNCIDQCVLNEKGATHYLLTWGDRDLPTAPPPLAWAAAPSLATFGG